MNLQQTQDAALADPPLVVPDPATEPVTVAQLDAEPTPIYDAVVDDHVGPIPGTDIRYSDLVA